MALSTKLVGDSMCRLFKITIIMMLDNKVIKKISGWMYLQRKINGVHIMDNHIYIYILKMIILDPILTSLPIDWNC